MDVTSIALSLLSQYGIFTLILPFLLIFSIVYMITDFTNMLKINSSDEQGRRITIVFAFAFALMAIENQTVMEYLISFLPNAAFVLLSILLFIMVITLYKKERTMPGWLKGLAVLLVILVILALGISAMGVSSGVSSSSVSNLINELISSGLMWIIVIFVIFIIIIAWMVSPGQTNEKGEVP